MSNLVKLAVESKELVDSLLSELDGVARDVNGYEYGLPMYESRGEMREAIYKFIGTLEVLGSVAKPASKQREQLAAQAMAGMLANPSYDANADVTTRHAFEQADSMIAFLESESK